MSRAKKQPPTPSARGAYIRAAHSAVSVERLNEYKEKDSESAIDRLGYYAWNIALCEALYPSLHLLEVALRNSLFDVLRREYPVPQTVRRNGALSWIDAGTLVLTQEHADRVRTVKNDLKQRLRGTLKPLTAGRLVAELSFGFWTYLFDSEYGFVSNTEPRLWPRLLKEVFPAVPNDVPHRRDDFESKLRDIRSLRNRAFHHEPIWSDPHLRTKYNNVIELLRWISPATARTLRDLDRFPDVHNEGAKRFLRRKVFQIATVDAD